MKETIERIIKENLQNFELTSAFGQRSVGDKIENDCSNIIKDVFGEQFRPASSKRSVEDLSIVTEDKTYLIDVKTHYLQEEEGFSMPNLISVKRLRKILKDDRKELIYIFVDYKRENDEVIIQDVLVKYVYDFDWGILGIGALGNGQLQIKNANKEIKSTDIGKEEWTNILVNNVKDFYRKEIIKIEEKLKSW
jgi:hypothetical protein